jgi:hypothetical protein
MNNPYVRFCETVGIIDCEILVDWVARDVARAATAPENDALHTLESLREAERWWVVAKKNRATQAPRGRNTL